MPATPAVFARFVGHPCRRALAAVLIALAALLAGAATPAPAAQKGVVPDMTWDVTEADQDRTAVALSDTGTQWVRLNMSWYWLDAYPGWWDKYDRAVRLARESGARVVMMLNQAPEWASGSTNIDAPPRDPADYGRAMRELVEHYRGQVDAYEIWNEPNHREFWPTAAGPDAAAYGELLKAGAAAVRAADPEAEVVFGGLAHNDYGFLEAAYAAHPDLGDHFDVMALHPYTSPFSQSPDVVTREADGRISPRSFTGYQEVHELLEARGDHKPIWFTEFGWSSATDPTVGVSEATQAEYLTRAFEIVEADPYVEVAIAYNFRNHYWALDADTWVDRLGMMNVDYTPKPVYHAYKAYQPPGMSAPVEEPATTEPLPTEPLPTEPLPEPLPTDPLPTDAIVDSIATEPIEEPATVDTSVEPVEEPAASALDVPLASTGATAPAPATATTAPQPGADAPPAVEVPPVAVPRLTLRILPVDGRSARTVSRHVRAGRRVRMAGRIAGASGARMTIRLQRRTAGGRWVSGPALRVRIGRDGRFRSRAVSLRAGRWRAVVSQGARAPVTVARFRAVRG